VVSYRIDEGQRVAVGTYGGFGFDCLDDMRHRFRELPGRDQVVRYPGRRSPDGVEAPGGVLMEDALLGGRDVVEERISDQGMPETVARSRVHDDQPSQRRVQCRVGLRLGQPGQRHELVGVETDPDDGHPLDGFASLDRQQAQPERAERSNGRGGRCPGHLDDRERQTARHLPDVVQRRGRDVGQVHSDELVGALPVQRA